MNFLLDENVCLDLAEVLRKSGHSVTAITEIAERGMTDDEVWQIAIKNQSILITRDYHFTNPTRFNPVEIQGIIFVRPGNLSSQEEILLVQKFLDRISPAHYIGKLSILAKSGFRVR